MKTSSHSGRRRPRAPRPHDEVRCLCSNLLARRAPRGIEVLCRRCKRKQLIPLVDDAAFEGAEPA